MMPKEPAKLRLRINPVSNTRTNADPKTLARIYSQPNFSGSLYSKVLH